MPDAEMIREAADTSQQQQILRWRRRMRVLLLFDVVVMVALVIWYARSPERVASHLPTFTEQLPSLQRGLMLLVVEICLCGVLAFLIGAAVTTHKAGGFLRRTLPSFLVAVGLAFICILALQVFKHGTPFIQPSVLVVGLAMLIAVFGTWKGVTWIRSRSTFKWALGQTLLLGCVLIGGLFVSLRMAVEEQPLPIAETKLSSFDRRQLVGIVRQHDPRDLPPDETGQLELSALQLTQLVSWGLSVLPGQHRGRVELTAGQATLQTSIELPSTSGFLNVDVSSNVEVNGGEFSVRPTRWSIGRLQLPDALLKLCGPVRVDERWFSPTVAQLLEAVQKVEIRDDSATLTYGHLDASEIDLRETLVEYGLVVDLEEAVAVHVHHLLELVQGPGRPDFQDCVQVVFEEAKRRSQNGDPVRENRAAILALGYTLGHPRLRMLLGDDVPRLSGDDIREFRRLTLRGRQDWTRHFWLSAALQVLGNTAVSLDVGVLKEELDADGGSGFSFGDLLADRAGTMLATTATSNSANAVQFQQHLTGEFDVASIMPPGADLPEGLQEAMFEARFGGVGGEEYQQMLAEIDRRIRDCAAYQ